MKHACITLLALFTAAPLLAEPAAEELMRKSLANYERSFKESVNYSYVQKDEEQDGATPKVTVAQVVPLEGTPYEKVIRRNGAPLAETEKEKEDRKYQQTVDKRVKESPVEKQKRVQQFMDSRAFLKEVPNAFDFKMLGIEAINGRPNYLIECTPKPGYHPASKYASMFQHIQAKLWIDKQDTQWTRSDANVVGTISIGWILARIGPGAKMTMVQAPVAPSVWLPKTINVDGAAKVMLVKNHPIHEHLTFSEYRSGTAANAALHN